MRIKFIQEIIDKFRKKAIVDVYIELIAPKIIILEQVISQINTLILGTSHPQLGYIAKELKKLIKSIKPTGATKQLI